ncbi:DUF6455 family protein [Ruegeria sp. HKCCD8929]|uniref:DUF6455 family protein n=1 Tax=Ruegeria sp. HKCCD8929 TaxID=2683006 RepID=UPI001489DCB1|nr:DUF6455 family protein [Ruegeria sp. HKCCD8929]
MKKPPETTEKHLKLMRSMAEKVGVNWSDAVEANPELARTYRHAALSCMQCQNAGECVVWQAEHEQVEDTPEYCLNRKLLKNLSKG